VPPHRIHAPARAGSALGLTLRSLIIAPGDDEARLAAAVKSGADAVVIDLVVAPEARPAARANAARLLAKARILDPALMVRVNPPERFVPGFTQGSLGGVSSPEPIERRAFFRTPYGGEG
jgi:hypothetical protein